MTLLPPERLRLTGVLQDRLLELAGTPDDSPRVRFVLTAVSGLAARLITAAGGGVSVTIRQADGHATVAASTDAAGAADRAQYRDDAGPCLEALEADYPASVPDIAATATWPSFRTTAADAGLRTSLSIPLYAASGATIAALNLYGDEPGALSALTTAVWAVYEPVGTDHREQDHLDPGDRELIAGLIAAKALRDMIQHAIRVIANADGIGAAQAYQTLCTRADEAGTSLTDLAAWVIEHRPGASPGR